MVKRIVQIHDLTKVYGHGEIAPEAKHFKGTLRLMVRVADPDRFLTPELMAKVDFLAE